MTIDEVRNYFGSMYKATQAINLHTSNYQAWKRRGNKIPLMAQFKLEKITNGALKVESPL